MLEPTTTPEPLADPIPTALQPIESVETQSTEPVKTQQPTEPVEGPTVSAARKIYDKIRHLCSCSHLSSPSFHGEVLSVNISTKVVKPQKFVDCQPKTPVEGSRWDSSVPEYDLEDPMQSGITITATSVTFNLVKINASNHPAVNNPPVTFPAATSPAVASQFFSQVPEFDRDMILSKKKVSLVYEVSDPQQPNQTEQPSVLDALRTMGGEFSDKLRRVVIVIKFPQNGHFREIIRRNSPDLLVLTSLAEYLLVACHNRIDVAVVFDLQTGKEPEKAHGRFGAPLLCLGMISENIRFKVITYTSDGMPPVRKRLSGKGSAGLRHGKAALQEFLAENIRAAEVPCNDPDQTIMG